MKSKDFKSALRKEFKTLKCPAVLKLFGFDNIFCFDHEYQDFKHADLSKLVHEQWGLIESIGLGYKKNRYDCENRGFSLYSRVVERWARNPQSTLQPPICLMAGKADLGLGKTGHAWNAWVDDKGVWVFDQGYLLPAGHAAKNYFPRLGIA
jgi:hypothetical protein